MSHTAAKKPSGPIPMARPRFSEEAISRVADAIRRGAIAAGPMVKELEGRLREALPHPNVIACANGTAALHTALWAVGAGPGRVVVTTAFSFVASASAIVHCGADPVFCDIDDSCNMDPAALEQVLDQLNRAGRKPAAVVFVHLYGNPSNADQVAAVCDRHGVAMVEDCAQAFGATLGGTPASGFGRVSAFSFYATKNVAAGEGGAVSSPDPALIKRASKFINHGRLSGYAHELIGYNYRMSDLHAILAMDQLQRFGENQKARIANADHLGKAVTGITGVRLPRTAPGSVHTFHQFSVLVPADQRDKLRDHLERDGISSAVHYPTPLPDLECFSAVRDIAGLPVPRARQASACVLSLPVHPELSTTETRRVADGFRAFFGAAPLPGPPSRGAETG